MEPPATPRFSVIIPAYNEERFLPRLLASLDAARDAYRGGRGEIEIVVADNASTDGTRRVAERFGCRLASVEKRVIAASRNGGARIARGEVLAFLDADMVRVHPRTFDAIDEALETGRVVAGATGVTLERWSTGIAVTFALLIPLVWLTGMDTGVVFCRRADFEAVGGYDERRLFAEDVALLVALRRLGRRRGQKLARLTGFKATASMRKFDEFGDWHYVTLVPKLLVEMMRGPAGGRRVAERYWYKPSR